MESSELIQGSSPNIVYCRYRFSGGTGSDAIREKFVHDVPAGLDRRRTIIKLPERVPLAFIHVVEIVVDVNSIPRHGRRLELRDR